jgi:hypothetical protein
VLRELRTQLLDDVNAFVLGDDGHEAPRWNGAHDCQRVGPRHAPPAALAPEAPRPPAPLPETAADAPPELGAAPAP